MASGDVVFVSNPVAIQSEQVQPASQSVTFSGITFKPQVTGNSYNLTFGYPPETVALAVSASGTGSLSLATRFSGVSADGTVQQGNLPQEPWLDIEKAYVVTITEA